MDNILMYRIFAEAFGTWNIQLPLDATTLTARPGRINESWMVHYVCVRMRTISTTMPSTA